jgi:hypothetical protein
MTSPSSELMFGVVQKILVSRVVLETGVPENVRLALFQDLGGFQTYPIGVQEE